MPDKYYIGNVKNSQEHNTWLGYKPGSNQECNLSIQTACLGCSVSPKGGTLGCSTRKPQFCQLHNACACITWIWPEKTKFKFSLKFQ